MNKYDTPLVSVIVITYNSANYVLETLESVKNQTYKNIELIISDDCSTDKTCVIVNEFIENNKNTFTNVALVNSSKNLGISFNCNRGVLSSSGNYIKLIAGDDLLTENCINDFVVFFSKNKLIQIAASQTKVFFKNDLNNFYIWPSKGQFPAGLDKQKKEILKANFVYNVSLFFTRKLYFNIGGFDENYPMFEDYPFDYKVINSGYEIFMLENVCVNYRVNFDSVTRPGNTGKFINLRLFEDSHSFVVSVILKELINRKMYVWYLLRLSKIKLIESIVKNGNSADKSKNKFFHKLLFLNKFISNKLRILENA